MNALAALCGSALLVALTGCATLGPPSARPQPVALHPSIALSDGERARLIAHADQGIDALRAYVTRTRMIHGYRLVDLL